MNTRMCVVRWLDGMKFRGYVEMKWGKVGSSGEKILKGNEHKILFETSSSDFNSNFHVSFSWKTLENSSVIVQTEKSSMLNVFQCFNVFELSWVETLEMNFTILSIILKFMKKKLLSN